MPALRTAAIRRTLVTSARMGSAGLLLASWLGSSSAAELGPMTAASPQAAAAHGSRPGSAGRGDPVRESMERLPAAELQAFYFSCSQEGVERRLDGAGAMACSIGYDVLLNKHFSGDFERFIAWSRTQRQAR